MTVFALIIINKAGGLIYHRSFPGSELNTISTNDYLVLAGTFHGIHAITARLNPLKHYPSPSSYAFPGTTAAATSSVSAAPGYAPSSATTASGGPGNHHTPGHSSNASIGAIAASAVAAGPKVRPDPPSGLEVLESETFRMQCFNTLTGTKFLLFTELGPPGGPGNVEQYLRRIYDLYADYVTKNPFYSLEMPIRCEIFDRKLGSYISEINSR
jgi:hypothetical protein